MRGLKVVATVRSDSGAEILKGVTKDLVVVSTQHENWPEAVAQACGNAPMVVVDPIGGETAPKLLGLLADGGTLLVFGGLDPCPSPISTIEIAVHQYTLKGITARHGCPVPRPSNGYPTLPICLRWRARPLRISRTIRSSLYPM